MEPIAAQSIAKAKLVRISFIVENKLNELETQLQEAETKLKYKELENSKLCATVAVLQDQLNSAEDNQKRLTMENKQLKLELRKTTTSLNIIECCDFESKYNESKAEYQILSNQLDLLEDDASELICENKQLIVVIETLQKSVQEITADKLETKNNLTKACLEISELKQMVYFYELAAEENSTHNLALQETINKALSISMQNTDESTCNPNALTADEISEEVINNLNTKNEDKLTLNSHCDANLGLGMKTNGFPTKISKNFGTEQDFKLNIINGSIKTVGFKNCGANSPVEIKRNKLSHKHQGSPKQIQIFNSDNALVG